MAALRIQLRPHLQHAAAVFRIRRQVETVVLIVKKPPTPPSKQRPSVTEAPLATVLPRQQSLFKDATFTSQDPINILAEALSADECNFCLAALV
jgi:hypothetical protein